MKYAILLIALFSYLTGNCQPVIPASSIPGPGTSWVQSLTEAMPDPGPAGANQTWDFSSVAYDGFSFETKFIDPVNTPHSNLFPTATLAGSYLLVEDTIMESFHEYYQVVGGLILVLGEANSFATTIYSDPQEIPYVNMTFGSMVTDDYVSTTTSMFGSSTSYGMTSHSYDAYGSVNLPMGMVNGVIRMHEFDISVDTIDSGFGSITISLDTSEIYSWVEPSSILPIATLEESRSRTLTFFNGVLINDEYVRSEVSFSVSGTGMSSTDDIFSSEYDQVTVYYQPNDHKLHVDLRNEMNDINFTIYSTSGKQLMRVNSGSVVSQKHTIKLPFSTTPGVYYLNIDGRVVKKFFVVGK